jgi:hypothetical protein
MLDLSKRMRSGNLLVILVVMTLGCILISQQADEVRLRGLLARYKGRYHKKVVVRLHNAAPTLDWPDQTPLGEVIEQIKVGTQSQPGMPMFQRGVPVVIDAAGLEEAGRSLSSPVPRPPADQELSLGKKLQTVLKPLGLACQVKDATIVITSERMVDDPFVEEDDDKP